jgi:hypothetical protein
MPVKDNIRLCVGCVFGLEDVGRFGLHVSGCRSHDDSAAGICGEHSSGGPGQTVRRFGGSARSSTSLTSPYRQPAVHLEFDAGLT